MRPLKSDVIPTMQTPTEPSVEIKSLIRELKLAPHPEGGWYRELYRSNLKVATPHGERCAITTIYYLLAAGQYSRWHVVAADEIWHLLDGHPLELITYAPVERQLINYKLDCTSVASRVA
ncbi:MAG: cupin domain-containing protein, partial [Nitrospirota bacterium]